MMRTLLKNSCLTRLILTAVCVSISTPMALGQEPAIGPPVLLPPPAATTGSERQVEPSLEPSTTLPAIVPNTPVESLPPPRSAITSPTEATPPWLAEPIAVDHDTLEEPVDDGPVWYNYPMVWLRTTHWDSGVELGVNGATGSNESVSIRTGGYFKRASEFAKININAYYNKTSAGGQETQSNAKLDISNDWLLDASSSWTLFSTTTLFYDKFQAFDVQANANGGVGYRVVNEEWLSITGRMGGGASREFGGPDDDWVPEAMFGLEYEQNIASNQSFYCKVEYFPEVEDVNEFRLVTDVGWEIELIQPSNVSLKLSLTDRYDSTPNGNDPQLLNYSLLLLWKI